MAVVTIYQPPPATTNSVETSGPAVPSQIVESVSYAKVSSDYLIGQAASVFQLARDLRGQMIPADGSRKAPALPPAGALELAQGLSALEKARQNLLDEFQQFEADSSTWAKYLKNGDERESKGGSRPRVFLKEAPEVMAAVNRARKEVQKACEKQC